MRSTPAGNVPDDEPTRIVKEPYTTTTDDAVFPADSTEERQGPTDQPPDPFDPKRLRLSQDFAAEIGVSKALLTVPVRKPGRENFVRTHPDPEFRISTCVVELKEERETYLVTPELWESLASESTLSRQMLVTTITRQDVLFLWPLKLPNVDGRQDEWSRSAMAAADLARESWVRVQANMHLGAYDTRIAVAELPPPNWPDVSMRDLLQTAFKDHLIDSLDHPVLKRLRGET